MAHTYLLKINSINTYGLSCHIALAVTGGDIKAKAPALVTLATTGAIMVYATNHKEPNAPLAYTSNTNDIRKEDNGTKLQSEQCFTQTVIKLVLSLLSST